MKAFICVFVAVLLVCGCMAEDPIEYAGSSAAAGTMFYPADTDNSPCMPGSDLAPYIAFNVTFATAGVREVAVMAEHDYKPYILVYVYTSFNPTDPCSNIVGGAYLIKQFSFDGGPKVDDFVHFQAGSYIFVVTGSSGSSGLFALHINPSTATGAIDNNSPYWTIINTLNSDGTCDYSSGYAPYATYTWTQASTGFYDAYALFDNSTVAQGDFNSYVAIYEGPVPSASGLQYDPCNMTAVGGSTIIYFAEEDGSKGVYYPYANLTANTTYTMVFSSNMYTAYWGVQIIPTRIRFFHNMSYDQPQRHTYPCTPSTDYPSEPWGVTMFNATHSTYLIDTASPPDPFYYRDTYSFMYLGNNSAVPPSTCGYPLVSDGDTGDVTPVFAETIPGQLYTVVVSTYSDGPTDSPLYAYVLYLFTGTDIQPANTTNTTTTTGSSSTATATTAAATTAGATTAAATTAAATTAAATTASATTAAATTAAATTSAAHTTSTSATTAAATTSSTSSKTTTSTSSTAAASTSTTTTAKSTTTTSTTGVTPTTTTTGSTNATTGTKATTSTTAAAATTAKVSTSTTSGASYIVPSVFAAGVAFIAMLF